MPVTLNGKAKTKRIIITGEREYRSALNEILQKANFVTVGEARYGKQAVAMVRKYSPDLCLIDMDTTSGALTAVKYISDERLCPVLPIVSSASSSLYLLGKNSGVLAFLNKHAETPLVLSTIYVVLSRWHEIMALQKELSTLKNTLATRKIIERAKGILIEKQSVTEAESYRLIQRYAMENRITMKSAAEKIIGEQENAETK